MKKILLLACLLPVLAFGAPVPPSNGGTGENNCPTCTVKVNNPVALTSAASSEFNIDSAGNNKGARPYPSLTTAQINAIVSPEMGLTVFDNELKVFKYFDGAWEISAAFNNLIAGSNITLLDNADGTLTISAAGGESGVGGSAVYNVSTGSTTTFTDSGFKPMTLTVDASSATNLNINPDGSIEILDAGTYKFEYVVSARSSGTTNVFALALGINGTVATQGLQVSYTGTASSTSGESKVVQYMYTLNPGDVVQPYIANIGNPVNNFIAQDLVMTVTQDVATPVTLLLPVNGGTGVANNNASTITMNGAFPLAMDLSANTHLTYVPSQRVYVDQTVGNDSTGNGTVSSPFLTIQAAEASITDASVDKPYEIDINGVFNITGDLPIIPWESISGTLGSQINLTGQLVLDSRWSSDDGSRAAVDGISIVADGGLNLVFTGPGGKKPFLFFDNDDFSGTPTTIVSGAGLTGDGETVVFRNCISLNGDPVYTFTNATGIMEDSTVSNGITVINNSAVTNNPVLIQTGKFLLGNVTVQTTSTGAPFVVINGAPSVGSTLTIDGTAATVVTDSVSWMPNPVFLNGATDANFLRLTYSEGIAEDYSAVNYTPASATVHDHFAAIDGALGSAPVFLTDTLNSPLAKKYKKAGFKVIVKSGPVIQLTNPLPREIITQFSVASATVKLPYLNEANATAASQMPAIINSGIGSTPFVLTDAAGGSISTIDTGAAYQLLNTSRSTPQGEFQLMPVTITVNGQFGFAEVTGSNTDAAYTPVNYTVGSNRINSNFQGIDDVLGTLEAATLQEAYDHGVSGSQGQIALNSDNFNPIRTVSSLPDADQHHFSAVNAIDPLTDIPSSWGYDYVGLNTAESEVQFGRLQMDAFSAVAGSEVSIWTLYLQATGVNTAALSASGATNTLTTPFLVDASNQGARIYQTTQFLTGDISYDTTRLGALLVSDDAAHYDITVSNVAFGANGDDSFSVETRDTNTLTLIPSGGATINGSGSSVIVPVNTRAIMQLVDSVTFKWQLTQTGSTTPTSTLPVNYVNELGVGYIDAGNITLNAGAARDSTDAFDIVLPGAQTVSFLVSGSVNGLDTGSVAINTWYAVFVIADSTNVNPAGGLLSVSATSPTLPAGYDIFRRVGWVRMSASAQIVVFSQTGAGNTRTYSIDDEDSKALVLAAGSATSFTAVSLSSAIPPTSYDGLLQFVYAPFLPTNSLSIRKTGTSTTVPITRVQVPGNMREFMPFSSDTSQSIDYKVASSDLVSLFVYSYVDNI